MEKDSSSPKISGYIIPISFFRIFGKLCHMFQGWSLKIIVLGMGNTIWGVLGPCIHNRERQTIRPMKLDLYPQLGRICHLLTIESSGKMQPCVVLYGCLYSGHREKLKK